MDDIRFNYHSWQFHLDVHLLATMGCCCCCNILDKALEKLMCSRRYSALMVGLEGSGKTTILYQLKLRQVVQTIPSSMFNVEEIDGFAAIWDVPGQPQMRLLWRHYFPMKWWIIFVVDSTDAAMLDNKPWDTPAAQQSSIKLINAFLFSFYRENSESVLCDDVVDIIYGYFHIFDSNFEEYQHPTAKEELHRLLKEDELRDAVLLVLANKQDLPNAMPIDVISERLELDSLTTSWRWNIIGSSAVEPFGLKEGIDWLNRAIHLPRPHVKPRQLHYNFQSLTETSTQAFSAVDRTAGSSLPLSDFNYSPMGRN